MSTKSALCATVMLIGALTAVPALAQNVKITRSAATTASSARSTER